MKRYLRSILYDLDPRATELLTAQLSLWFAWQIAVSNSAVRPAPWWLWSGWCGMAALCKAAGVLPTLVRYPPPWWSPWLRGIGSLLGLFFWVVLAMVFYILARGGITWGGFAILAAVQGWAFFRVIRRGA